MITKKASSVSEQKEVRDSNLELFRILVMLLIVIHHYVVNSGLMEPDGPIMANLYSWRSVFLLLVGAWGKTGINCFMLITGYFMCKSHITFKKYAKLLLEIYFYRFVISFAFIVTGYSAFTARDFIKLIVPFTYIKRNFTGCYLVFFLCIPFLNVLIRNLNERQHLLLLALAGSIFVLFGSVPFFDLAFSYVSWFCVLYFIASYIRMYPKHIFDKTGFWGWMTLLSFALSAVSVLVCTYGYSMLGKQPAPYEFVGETNKIFAVCLGVSSFLFFKNVRIRNSGVINAIAATTFGVLQIHANSDTMRTFLWNDIFRCTEMYSSKYLVASVLGGGTIVFIVCSLVDMLRIHFIEKPLFARWDKWGGRLEGRIKAIIDRRSKIEQ